jgi:hypothetical protein
MESVNQLAGGNAPSTLPDFGGDKGGNTPLFGGVFGTPTYVLGPDTSNMFKDLYVDSSNRPGALIASWIKGEITFEELKAAIPNEEFRNSLLGQFGYNPEGNLIDVVGEPVIGPATVTKVKPEPETGAKTEPEPEPTEPFELPTWEEVWEKAKDAVAKNPQAAGDILREILESMGVPVPQDINDILQGGYGVVWDERTGGIFNENGIIFVPGVPVGGPPTSVEVGTIGEILAGEGGEAVERTIQTILSEVGVVFDEDGKPVDYDPSAILDVIIGTQAEDVPPSVLEAILTGSATIGAIDWLKDLISGGAEQPTPTPVPPISGATDSGEEEPEPAGLAFGHEWSDEPIAGPEITPEVLDLNKYATIDPDLTGDGEVTRTGGESILSFGPEFVFDTDTEVINGTLDDPTQEVLSDSGSDGGAGGGGGGGGAGTSEDFLRGLSYRPLQVAPVAARPVVDYTAGLFTQPTSRMSGLQLGGITAGLFGDMIG